MKSGEGQKFSDAKHVMHNSLYFGGFCSLSVYDMTAKLSGHWREVAPFIYLRN